MFGHDDSSRCLFRLYRTGTLGAKYRMQIAYLQTCKSISRQLNCCCLHHANRLLVVPSIIQSSEVGIAKASPMVAATKEQPCMALKGISSGGKTHHEEFFILTAMT